MKMKSTYPLALIMAAGAILAISPSVRASNTDSRIESSAAKSYVFKTYLKNDSIKTESKDCGLTSFRYLYTDFGKFDENDVGYLLLGVVGYAYVTRVVLSGIVMPVLCDRRMGC